MVAETLTATRAASTFPITDYSGAGVVQCAWGTYAVAANVEDGDIFEMCRVPAGATIVGGYFSAEDLDTGAEALDLMVGWAANGTDAADPNGLLLAGVKTGDISVHLDVASTWMPFGGQLLEAGPVTLSGDTTIQVEANAAATTFAAGQMTVVVFYTTS
jgi:hypothetical protein